MSIATMTIDFLAGTYLPDAKKEAERLSKVLGVTIHFNFNGTKHYVTGSHHFSIAPGEYWKATKASCPVTGRPPKRPALFIE